MTTVNMHEAKSQLSKLVDQACRGEEVIIARNGKPAARLVPIEAPAQTPRPMGLHTGQIWMSDDFNEPMPDEFTGIPD